MSAIVTFEFGMLKFEIPKDVSFSDLNPQYDGIVFDKEDVLGIDSSLRKITLGEIRSSSKYVQEYLSRGFLNAFINLYRYEREPVSKSLSIDTNETNSHEKLKVEFGCNKFIFTLKDSLNIELNIDSNCEDPFYMAVTDSYRDCQTITSLFMKLLVGFTKENVFYRRMNETIRDEYLTLANKKFQEVVKDTDLVALLPSNRVQLVSEYFFGFYPIKPS